MRLILQEYQNVVVLLISKLIQDDPLIILDWLVVIINKVFEREQYVSPGVGTLD